MADLADLANQVTEAFLSEAMRQRATQTAVKVDHCVTCGEDMVSARKALGLQHCIECAQEMESRQRR